MDVLALILTLAAIVVFSFAASGRELRRFNEIAIGLVFLAAALICQFTSITNTHICTEVEEHSLVFSHYFRSPSRRKQPLHGSRPSSSRRTFSLLTLQCGRRHVSRDSLHVHRSTRSNGLRPRPLDSASSRHVPDMRTWLEQQTDQLGVIAMAGDQPAAEGSTIDDHPVAVGIAGVGDAAACAILHKQRIGLGLILVQRLDMIRAPAPTRRTSPADLDPRQADVHRIEGASRATRSPKWGRFATTRTTPHHDASTVSTSALRAVPRRPKASTHSSRPAAA